MTTDEADKFALYKHEKKLDTLCKANRLAAFSSLIDYTDMQVNLEVLELEPGMESTDELMAVQGVWQSAEDALRILEPLLNVIESEKTRFGVIGNAHDDVVLELEESIRFAREAVSKSANFNFAVVG